jgi:hypothetical protein
MQKLFLSSRKHKLLVGPSMPGMLKDKARWSVVPCPPGWELGVELTTPSRKKITLNETMEEA